MPEKAVPSEGRLPFDISARSRETCAELRRAAIAMNHPLPPEPFCEQLHEAMERAANRSAESMNLLRDTVGRFTIALRDEGASPEAILIALKSVINSRTFPSVVSPSRDGTGDQLRQQISTWCIEEFFAGRQA